jgi:hypothetical protein
LKPQAAKQAGQQRRMSGQFGGAHEHRGVRLASPLDPGRVI